MINRVNSKGYTLVELLAVTSLIVIVSGLIIGILYSTLRGGSKSKVTNDVSQNGNFALSIISNTALLAESITEIDGNPVTDCTTKIEGTSIEFEKPDGGRVAFSCDAPSESIASVSGSLTTYLIDNNTVKVDPASCNFSCFQENNSPYSQPIIGISFTVTQRSGSSNFENRARADFKTSVTMRNFSFR